MLRLSARAQAVLDLAHELARREPGFEPHSGHLLVALVRAGGALIDDTFLRLTLDYEDVLAAVENAGSTADAKRELGDALAAAGRVAEADNQAYISAWALAGGLVAAPESVAGRALAALGVTAEALRGRLDAPRDMLVPLLALSDPAAAVERAAQAGVRIRRARAWEAPSLAAFIESERFARSWAPETHNAFARQPISAFIAERDGRIAGSPPTTAACAASSALPVSRGASGRGGSRPHCSCAPSRTCAPWVTPTRSSAPSALPSSTSASAAPSCYHPPGRVTSIPWNDEHRQPTPS